MNSGDKFNRWTAIKFVEKRASNYYWQFRCDCGTEKTCQTGGVTSGASKSCGCLRTEMLATLRAGDVYNRLTAIRPCADRHSYWEFKCVCGKDHVAKIYEVRNGAIKSCGCLRDERRAPQIKSGDVFSDLTAVRQEDVTQRWVFKCVCGTECSPRAHRVVNGRIKSCGCRRSLYEVKRATSMGSGKSRITRMLTTRKRDARLRGISFSLSRSDIESLVEAQNWKCARTGLPLDLTACDGIKPFGPSLDRIDNARGYEPGNIQLVCYMYNAAKNQFTDADVLQFAKALLNHSDDAIEAFKRAA